MNILIISPQIPFPPIDGGKAGIFYPIKYLSRRGHNISLLCLSESENRPALDALRNYCDVEIVFHQKKIRILKAITSILNKIPYDIKRYESLEMIHLIDKIISSSSFDIVQVEGIHSAIYGIEAKKKWNLPVLMRAHNIHYMNFFRFIRHIKNPLAKIYLCIESRKLKKYETIKSQLFDRVLTVSEKDKKLLLSLNSNIKCEVLEAGVEINNDNFEPSEQGNNTILWMGALQWKPNQDSLIWFIESIVPEIIRKRPEAKIKVIGSNPPVKIMEIRHPNVDIIGTVDDVKPFLKSAEICVVPLRVGSGIRLKILEMFSMKKAVVSTTIGCEGIPVKDGEHLLIADKPKQFADAVIELMDNPDLRSKLGNAGYLLVKKYYSWEYITEKLERTYKCIIDEHKKKIP